LIKGAKTGEDEVLLVDVGGSLGHDISEFRKKHPSAPGRLVLQDLPAVIAQGKDLDSKIEPKAHDFFTEQPIKGARAYYMHSVLHDWPDDLAEQILKTLKPAMEPGYSRLLLNENLIPDTNAHWETTALDLLMMTMVSAKERTETQWRHLIEERAGLKIVNIWGLEIGNGVESLIECELP